MHTDLPRDASAAYLDQAIADERAIPLRTCLGSGCCPECGQPRALTVRGAELNESGCYCSREGE